MRLKKEKAASDPFVTIPSIRYSQIMKYEGNEELQETSDVSIGYWIIEDMKPKFIYMKNMEERRK